jgi:hypothetical protein
MNSSIIVLTTQNVGPNNLIIMSTPAIPPHILEGFPTPPTGGGYNITIDNMLDTTVDNIFTPSIDLMRP